jgi:hypothetical protein
MRSQFAKELGFCQGWLVRVRKFLHLRWSIVHARFPGALGRVARHSLAAGLENQAKLLLDCHGGQNDPSTGPASNGRTRAGCTWASERFPLMTPSWKYPEEL